MTKRLCILTPDPTDPSVEGRWPEVFARMAAPLEALGATVEPRPWTDTGDLSGFAGNDREFIHGSLRCRPRWGASR